MHGGGCAFCRLLRHGGLIRGRRCAVFRSVEITLDRRYACRFLHADLQSSSFLLSPHSRYSVMIVALDPVCEPHAGRTKAEIRA